MTFVSHTFFDSQGMRFLRYVLIALAALVAGCLLVLIVLNRRVPVEPLTGAALPTPMVMPQTGTMELAFSVFRGAPTGDASDAAAFLDAFRFVGTFFFYGADAAEELRRGVLSYLPEKRQEIVSVGSTVAGVNVTHIGEDHILLEKDGVEGKLLLGGEASARIRSSLDSVPLGAPADPSHQSRFGVQTAEGVWMLQKDALQAYYQELLEEPERLLQVFDSMAPLYADNGASITGYQLQTVGEKDFFDAVGFQEGDIVRKVNALPMTNRGRAEFFIKQVVKDRMSAIVIDIEREGSSKRLVYQLR